MYRLSNYSYLEINENENSILLDLEILESYCWDVFSIKNTSIMASMNILQKNFADNSTLLNKINNLFGFLDNLLIEQNIVSVEKSPSKDGTEKSDKILFNNEPAFMIKTI